MNHQSIPKDVNVLQAAQETFHQYDIVLTYQDKDGNETMALSPMLDSAYPILLVNENGDNLLVERNLMDFDKNPEWKWAEKHFNELKEDIDLLIRRNPTEGIAWSTFQQQGGILAICENGEARTACCSLSGKRGENLPKSSSATGGSCTGEFPVVGINVSGFESRTTLLHELTHNLSHTIHTFENTDAFNAAMYADLAKESQTLKNVLAKVETLVKQGHYSQNNRNSEVFARLHEEKTKDPQGFAKDAPTMNAFFEHIVYPTTFAHTQNYTEALHQMTEALNPLPTLQKNTKQLKAIIQEREALVNAEKNAGWTVNSQGYKQRDGKAPDVVAAREALKKYQVNSEQTVDHSSSQLISYFKDCHSLAASAEKIDKREISHTLKQYDTYEKQARANTVEKPRTLNGRLTARDAVTTPPKAPERPSLSTISRNNVQEAWKNIPGLYKKATESTK